jgi:hypothetical protein
LIYSYYQLSIQEERRILVPLPGSRLLRLNGSHWSDMVFSGDFRLYIDVEDGGLVQVNSGFQY